MSIAEAYKPGHWIVARYHSTCQCQTKINPGDDMWYSDKVLCSTCGHKLYPEELKDLLAIRKNY